MGVNKANVSLDPILTNEIGNIAEQGKFFQRTGNILAFILNPEFRGLDNQYISNQVYVEKVMHRL